MVAQQRHPSRTTCIVRPASSKREVDSTCSSATWAGGAAVAATRTACRAERPDDAVVVEEWWKQT